jgi:hypothetical protein
MNYISRDIHMNYSNGKVRICNLEGQDHRMKGLELWLVSLEGHVLPA